MVLLLWCNSFRSCLGAELDAGYTHVFSFASVHSLETDRGLYGLKQAVGRGNMTETASFQRMNRYTQGEPMTQGKWSACRKAAQQEADQRRQQRTSRQVGIVPQFEQLLKARQEASQRSLEMAEAMQLAAARAASNAAAKSNTAERRKLVSGLKYLPYKRTALVAAGVVSDDEAAKLSVAACELMLLNLPDAKLKTVCPPLILLAQEQASQKQAAKHAKATSVVP